MPLQLTRNSKPSTVVGLEIEAGSLAAAEIRRNGRDSVGQTAVGPLSRGAFSEGEVRDGDVLAEALSDFFAENNLPKQVRLGVANQGVVVRTLRLPVIEDPKELAAAVRFQAQEQLPMPLDQAVLDHRVVGGATASGDASPQIDVIVVAARRDMISTFLDPLRKARLQPVGIDLSAFGMIRALAGTNGHTPSTGEAGVPEDTAAGTLYCHIGAVTNLAVARGRACLFTRISPVGLEAIISRLADSSGLTPEHAKMWMEHVGMSRPVESIEGDPQVVAAVRDGLGSGFAAVRDAVRLSLDFYRAQETAVAVDRVVLCGPGGAIDGVTEFMQAALDMPFEKGFPQALASMNAADAARLTLPYGLGLED